MGNITVVRRRCKSAPTQIEHLTDPVFYPFFAAIASNPTDRLTRMVLADFLDERGSTANVNWSRYIRLVDHIWEGIELNRKFLARDGEAERLRDIGPDGVRELNRIARENDRERTRHDLADWYKANGFSRRADFVRLQIKNENRTPTPDQENREYDLLLAVWRKWMPSEVTMLKGTADKGAACGEGGWGGSRLKIPSRAIVGNRVTNPAVWFLFEKGLPVTCWCDRVDYARLRESLLFRFPWIEFKRVKDGREYFDPWIDTSCDSDF